MVWNHAVFSKNRDRLLNQALAGVFFAKLKARAAGLISDEHFTVDGTLIEAWASHRSFQRNDDGGNAGPGASRSALTRHTTSDFVRDARALYEVSLGVGQRPGHPGYAISLSKRWLVEKPFGWLKRK